MILEFKVDENAVQAAWLKTLYDLVDELNCKCNTYLDETTKGYNKIARTRIIEIYGSDTMVSWLKLRMERYNHFINSYTDGFEIETNIISEDE
ncbi:MAG: hypothetical protein PHV68_06885 [Candidatus Gastranaerophilales bacterium]|nr:hypothetical protein [Candidatus Gastranaerophilales bacterium]